MKNFIFLLFVFLFLALKAHAAVSLSVGQLMMNQRNNMMTDEPIAAADFSGFYTWDQYQVGIEYFQFATLQTGNSTFSTTTKSNALQFVGQYLMQSKKLLRPYLTAGLGFEQLNTRISLYSSASEDQSKAYFLGFAGLGLRVQFIDEIHVGTEARLNFGEIRDPNPAWSLLLNIGIDLK